MKFSKRRITRNCRCFFTPVTVSYRELGLNIDEMQASLRPYTERADKRAIIEAEHAISYDLDNFRRTAPELPNGSE